MRRWLRELLRQKSSYNNSYRIRKMQGIGSKLSHKITARFPRLENSFNFFPLGDESFFVDIDLSDIMWAPNWIGCSPSSYGLISSNRILISFSINKERKFQ